MRQHSSGGFLDNFPGTAGLLMVISAFFVLEFLTDRNHPDAADPVQLSLFSSFRPEVFVELGSSVAGKILDGELWRLIACTFLHAGLIHIAFNGLSLMDLGRICEPLLGTERFLTVYLATGLGGSLASLGWHWWSGHWGGHSVGASGAICGLIGLLLGFSLRHRDRELRQQVMRSVVYLVVLSVAIPFIDHFAHAGGLLTGAVFGFFTPRYCSSGSLRRWRIPCWILCALTAASLGWAVWNSFSQ